MGSSGEKSAKKAKKEKRGTNRRVAAGVVEEAGETGLPVPSTPGDEDEDTPDRCARCLAVGRWEVNQEGVESREKGTRVLFFFVQQRGERKILF